LWWYSSNNSGLALQFLVSFNPWTDWSGHCTDTILKCVLIPINDIPNPCRAPDASDPVNFNVFSGQQFPVLSGINTAATESRDGRQSVLGCLKGCTRELRPVRGEQGGRERILPNKCTFDVEACKSKRSR